MAKRKKQAAAPAAKVDQAPAEPSKPARGRPPRAPAGGLKGAFGQRLKALRSDKGMTGIELAEAAGLAKSAVYNYEAGVFEPGLEQIVKLAKALGMTASELLSGL